MFIVKLILVPIWPFFFTNWCMKKSGEGFDLKKYVATLLISYVMLIAAACWIGGKVMDAFNSDSDRAPVTQTAKEIPAADAK